MLITTTTKTFSSRSNDYFYSSCVVRDSVL